MIYKSGPQEEYGLRSTGGDDLVCTDETALHRYLSSLRMEHISGNYSFAPEGRSLFLIFDIPKGVLAVTLSDRFLKLVPLYGKANVQYYYLPDGIDWDGLGEYMVECPPAKCVHDAGRKDE